MFSRKMVWGPSPFVITASSESGIRSPPRSVHEEVSDRLLVVAILLGEPDENGGDPVRLVDVGGLDPVEGRLDDLGHLVDRDPEPAELLAVEPDDQLGDAGCLFNLEIGRAFDAGHDIPYLLDFIVERGEIRTEELDGQLSLRAGEHLSQLVGDRLLEDISDARELVELPSHRLGELLEVALPLFLEARARYCNGCG